MADDKRKGDQKPQGRDRSAKKGSSLGRTQAALSDPNQLAALMAVLQILQGQAGRSSSPDIGTLPSNFPAGGFATTSGQVPVSGVGPATLGGMPFQPNPVASGIAGVGSIMANSRQARQVARERQQSKQRQKQVDELVRILMERARGGGGSGKSSAKERVGLGEGQTLPAARGGRRTA